MAMQFVAVLHEKISFQVHNATDCTVYDELQQLMRVFRLYDEKVNNKDQVENIP